VRLIVPPRQELVDPVDLVVSDAAKDIGEPSLRIDTVELGCFDQSVDNGSRFSSALRPFQADNHQKIGAKVVRHGRYVIFQLAEVAMPRSLFRKILDLIDDLRRSPVPAQAEKNHGEIKRTGEVRLDDDKIGRMCLGTRTDRKIGDAV